MPGRHSWEMLILTNTALPATGGPQQPIRLQANSRQALPESTWLASLTTLPSPPEGSPEGRRQFPWYSTSSSLWQPAYGVFGWHWSHRRASWHGYYYPSGREVAFNYFSAETWLFSVNGIQYLISVHSLCKPNNCSFIRKTCTLLQKKIIQCHCKAFGYNLEKITLKKTKSMVSLVHFHHAELQNNFSHLFLFFRWGDPSKVALATWRFPQRCSGKAALWSLFIIDGGFHLPTGTAVRGSNSCRMWSIPRSRRWTTFH